MHHLAIRPERAATGSDCVALQLRADVVVEFVAPEDAMVRRLLRNRDTLDFGYTQDRFEACLSKHFVIASKQSLQSGRPSFLGSSHKCMHDSGMISPITRRPQDEE